MREGDKIKANKIFRKGLLILNKAQPGTCSHCEQIYSIQIKDQWFTVYV